MTREQAKKSIENGLKITHKYFDKDEYVTLENKKSGLYITEDGTILNPGLFWIYRRKEPFLDGWDIYEPKS